MSDETVAAATTQTEAAGSLVEDSLLAKAGSPVVSADETVLDTAGAEAKAQQDAENKRILEADDKTLKPEELTKKAELVKANEDAKAKALAEEKAKGVPEKYDIKPPEGLTLDEDALARATPVFKKLGITNAQAQGLSDHYAQVMKDAVAANDAKFKEWNEANIKDTMATLGANAKSELAAVAKVRALMSPETIEALNASGIGNIKSFILDMAKIGKLFSEERMPNDRVNRPPSNSTGSNEEFARQLYPSMNQK